MLSFIRFPLAAIALLAGTIVQAAPTALQWGVDRTTTPWTTCVYDANNTCQGAFTVPATGGGVLLPASRGGTGVNNGASTITLGGALSTSGAFALAFTLTGGTNLTLPTSGTVTALGNSTTGSGAFVLATSPTLITPNLGTPSAINLSNATNLPTSALPASAAQLSNTNSWTGNQYFGSGKPWLDVRSNTQGCAAAVPGQDNAAALQCKIDYLNTNFGGGVLYFPMGNYQIASTITVKGNVILQGVGQDITAISITTDNTAVAFDSSTTFGAGIDRIEITGITSSPTQNLVTVANGRAITLSNCNLVGGKWALQTGGSDGEVRNCSLQGYGAAGGGILSSGSNTYNDAKLDQSSASVLAAFEQVACFNGSVCENRFVNSDMSGTYTDSLIIADTNNQALTEIVSTVISSPISITGAQATMFANDEFGSTVLAASGIINIVGSTNVSGGAITVSGGTQNCSGNSSITCTPLPAAQGGTGRSSLGSGVATALGNAANASGGFVTSQPNLVVFYARGVNFNSGNTDTQFTVSLPGGSTRYIVQSARILNASQTLTTATFGLFTAAAGGGTAVIPGGTAITVSTASDGTNNNAMNVSATNQNTQAYTLAGFPTLFFRVGTAEGAAATADVAIVLAPL